MTAFLWASLSVGYWSKRQKEQKKKLRRSNVCLWERDKESRDRESSQCQMVTKKKDSRVMQGQIPAHWTSILSATVALISWLQLSCFIKQQLWSKETLRVTYACNTQNTPPSLLLWLEELSSGGEWDKLCKETKSVFANKPLLYVWSISKSNFWYHSGRNLVCTACSGHLMHYSWECKNLCMMMCVQFHRDRTAPTEIHIRL